MSEMKRVPKKDDETEVLPRAPMQAAVAPKVLDMHTVLDAMSTHLAGYENSEELAVCHKAVGELRAAFAALVLKEKGVGKEE